MDRTPHEVQIETGKVVRFDEGLFCPVCGRVIQPNAKFCLHCSAAILRRYCPGCNRLVPDATKVCPYCGVSADTPAKDPTRYALGIIGPALFVAICFFFLAKQLALNRNHQQAAPAKFNASEVTLPGINQQKTKPVVKQQAIISSEVSQNSAEMDGAHLNVIGHNLLKEKRYDEAIPVLQKAVDSFSKDSKDPAYPYALFNLGQALRRSGHPQQAIPVLEDCLKIMPEKDWAETELDLAKEATK